MNKHWSIVKNAFSMLFQTDFMREIHSELASKFFLTDLNYFKHFLMLLAEDINRF